jgi:integrase
MPLTEIAIRNAKPADKLKKLSDGRGLQLHIFPNGSKLWRVAYRYDGKQKLLAVGNYPDVPLTKARERALEVHRRLDDGLDPSHVRKLERITGALARAETFGTIADEFMAKCRARDLADVTVAKKEWLLGFALADLKDRPIREISAAEVLASLRKVEKRGTLESARRLRSVIGQVFRYAIATARAENDPTIALHGALTPPKVKHRAAILDRVRLGELMAAVDSYEGLPTTRAALQLAPLVFVRPGELRMAKWPEFNLEAAEWLIPAERTKMRREHLLPLSRQAVAILEALRPLTGYDGQGYLFPSVRTHAKPMSENTLNKALRSLGFGKGEACTHGFRATASTFLNESGLWSGDAVERALAHQEQNAVRRAYARGTYWDERVRMAQWWADWLESAKNTSAFA